MGGVCDLQCLWRALVSSSGLDSRQAECEVDDEEQSESCFFILAVCQRDIGIVTKKALCLASATELPQVYRMEFLNP
jgi:hypothetical protein